MRTRRPRVVLWGARKQDLQFGSPADMQAARMKSALVKITISAERFQAALDQLGAAAVATARDFRCLQIELMKRSKHDRCTSANH